MSTEEEAKKISVKTDWQMFPLIHLAAGDMSYEASPVKMVDERWTPNGSSSNDSISTFRPMQIQKQMQMKYKCKWNTNANTDTINSENKYKMVDMWWRRMTPAAMAQFWALHKQLQKNTNTNTSTNANIEADANAYANVDIKVQMQMQIQV